MFEVTYIDNNQEKKVETVISKTFTGAVIQIGTRLDVKEIIDVEEVR